MTVALITLALLQSLYEGKLGKSVLNLYMLLLVPSKAECLWCFVSHGSVWSEVVVLLSTVIDDLPGVGEAGEVALSETAVAQLSVEALAVPVLHGLSGLDEGERHFGLAAPHPQGAGRELGAVVHDDSFGQAVGLDVLPEHAHKAFSRQGGVRFDGQALAREGVHHDQRPEASSAGQRVADEVHAPDLTGSAGPFGWPEPTPATASLLALARQS